MDIMGPPLEEQVDPAPWLASRRNMNVPALVDRILQRRPEASEKEVIDTLADWNIQANGALVARQVLEFRRRRQAAADLASAETEAARRAAAARGPRRRYVIDA